MAYSFLTALFEGTSYDVPFVIDSPAGPMDLAVRRESFDRIPDLFGQMIGFVTSGERAGMMDGIENRTDVQYYTVEKKEDPKLGYVLRISNDKEYFRTFQEKERSNTSKPSKTTTKASKPAKRGR